MFQLTRRIHIKESQVIENNITSYDIQKLAEDPSNPEEGDFWYNTTEDKYKGYDGTSIVELGSISIYNNYSTSTVMYASPSGTGDGLTSITPSSLSSILDLNISCIIHLVNAGEYVISSKTISKTTEIIGDVSGCVICTPHTVSVNISNDILGSPSPSQSCTAHTYSEVPFIATDLSLANVVVRTTSPITLKGDVVLSNVDFYSWVYSPSPVTLPSLYPVVYLKDCTLRCSSKITSTLYRGISTSTTKLQHIQTENSVVTLYETEFYSYPAVTGVAPIDACFHGLNSEISIVKTLVDNVRVVCNINTTTTLNLDHIYMTPTSQPLSSVVIAASGSSFTIKPTIVWRTDTQKVRCDGIAFDVSNAKGDISTVHITGVGVANQFTLADCNSDVFLDDCIVLAENRAGNLGFSTGFECKNAARISVSSITITTRNYANDTFAKAYRGAISSAITASYTCSKEFNCGSGGLYIDPAGSKHS